MVTFFVRLLSTYHSDLFSRTSKDLEPLKRWEHLNTQMSPRLRGNIKIMARCAIETGN